MRLETTGVITLCPSSLVTSSSQSKLSAKEFIYLYLSYTIMTKISFKNDLIKPREAPRATNAPLKHCLEQNSTALSAYFEWYLWVKKYTHVEQAKYLKIQKV